MRKASLSGPGVHLIALVSSFGCSSPSDPFLPPPDSHHLVVVSGNALLAISDTGGVTDTLAIPAGASSLVWHEVSPDGRSAAVVVRYSGPQPVSELQLISLEGVSLSNPVTGFSGSIGTSLSWSPDSQRLVFSTRLPSEIMTVRLDGTGLDTLVTLPFAGENPHWSPAGDRIVYAGRDTRVSDMDGLWTIRPDGSGATHIADESVFISGTTGKLFPVPRFSPSGEWIAFESSSDIHVIRADGTGRRQLTATPSEDEWHFRWSPAGDRIAYIGDGGARWAIRMMSFPEGGPAGAVEYDVSSDMDSAYPEWSPDGERIAFMSTRLLAGTYRLPSTDGVIATARGEEFSTWSAAPLPIVLGSGRRPQWWPGH